MKFQYYPGCSLKGTGKAYEESLLPVFEALGVEIEELKDWNCCGATAYMSVDEGKAFALTGRNLAIAGRAKEDVMAPCAACYLSFNKTQHYIDEYPEVKKDVSEALKAANLNLPENIKVRHPLDILVNDIGLETIKQKVKKPLTGLKVAPYYGCQIVRPYALFDNQSNPQTMDNILRALGAEVVEFHAKTRCCGGSLTGTVPQAGVGLVKSILMEAQKRKADVICTVCPLCQFNLDGCAPDVADSKLTPVPTFFLTQLMGLALGLPKSKLGIKRSIVSPRSVIAKLEAQNG